jgi:sulfur carrier protein ThiS
MPAFVKHRGKLLEVPAGITIRDACIRLEIEPESVLPTRDGELVTDDEQIRDGQTIRLVRVISGGSRGVLQP